MSFNNDYEVKEFIGNLKYFKIHIDECLLPGLWDKTIRAAAEQITEEKLKQARELVKDYQYYPQQMKILDSIGLPFRFADELRVINIPKIMYSDENDKLFVDLERRLNNKEEFYKRHNEKWYRYYFRARIKDGEYRSYLTVKGKERNDISKYYYLLGPRCALYVYMDTQNKKYKLLPQKR